MPNRLQEILETPVTPKKVIVEAGNVLRATAKGAIDGLQLYRKDPQNNVDRALLIPLRSLLTESRCALGRLFKKSDEPKS